MEWWHGLAMKRDPARKLKLQRLRHLAEQKLELPLEEVSGGRVELCEPTAEQPFIRRYVPEASRGLPARLGAAGVLDWRAVGRGFHPAPGGAADSSQVPIETVANHIICSDAEAALRRLPAESVTCVITSPPYWHNVDYGFEGQLGLYAEAGVTGRNACPTAQRGSPTLTPALSLRERERVRARSGQGESCAPMRSTCSNCWASGGSVSGYCSPMASSASTPLSCPCPRVSCLSSTPGT